MIPKGKAEVMDNFSVFSEIREVELIWVLVLLQ